MSSQYSRSSATRNSISLANAAPSIPEPPRRAASARAPQHNMGASRPTDHGVGSPLQRQAGFLPHIPGVRIAGSRSGTLGPAQTISTSAQSARERDASPLYLSSSTAAGASSSTKQQSPVPRSKPRNVLFGGGSSAQRNVTSTSSNATTTVPSSTPIIRDGKSIAEDIHAAAHAYFRDRAFEKEQRREAFQRQTRMMLLSKNGENDRGTMPSPTQEQGLPSELAEGGERRHTTTVTTLVVQDTASPRHAGDEGENGRSDQSAVGAPTTSYLMLDTHQQRIVLQTAYRSRQALPPSSSTSEKDGRVLALASSFNEKATTTETEAAATSSSATVTATASKGRRQSIAEVMSSVKGYFDDDDFRLRQEEQERKRARGLGEAPLEKVRDTMAPTGFLNPNKLVFLRQRADELMDEERAAQQARQREALVSEEAEARPLIPQQAERALMTSVASWLKSFPPGYQLEMLSLQQRYFPSALSKPSAGGIGGEGGGRALHGRKAVIVDVPEGAGMRPFRKAAFGSSRRKKSMLRAGGQSRGQGGDGSSPESAGGLNNKAKAYSPRRRSSATLADIDNFFASIADDDEGGAGSLLPSIGKGRRPNKGGRRQRPSRNEDDQSGMSDEHSQQQPRGGDSKASKNPGTGPTGGTNTSATEVSPSPSLLAAHTGAHHEVGHPQPQSLAPTSSSARPPEAAVGAHHLAVGRQVREALARVGVVYDGFTSSSLYSTYGGSSSSAADTERRNLHSIGGSHPSRSDAADTEEPGTATASIRRDGADSSLAQLSSDLRGGQVSSSSRAHSLFTTTSAGDALTSYYSMTDIGGDRSPSASRSSPSLRSYSEALSSVSGVARLKDDDGIGLDDDAASASNSSKSRSHSRTASVTSALSPTTSHHVHLPSSFKEGEGGGDDRRRDGGATNEDATHTQRGHQMAEKTPTRDLPLSTTSKSSPPALKQKDATPQSASRQYVGSKHTAAPPLPPGSNAQTTAAPPTAVTIRRNPQAFAVATAAATRVTQETRALLTELIELELHSRLVCNWFGSPSPQILQRFGLVASDMTPLDEALTLREGGVPASFSSSYWPLLRANNNNISKNSVLERPSWLLHHRLFPRLSSSPPLPSLVPVTSTSPPVLGSSIHVPAATRESLTISTATASVGEARRSSNAPPAEAPPTARSVLTSALSTFEFLFEQSFPLLIGAQLGFSTDTSTVQPDSFVPPSATADRTRAHALRQALVTAIDAYRVTDVAAANAQAVSKATGLRKAHVAAQAASSSAALAAQTVGRMLEALLPPFLRPEQQEKHMILLSEASSRTRNGPRGRHTKSSAHLRPNPLVSLADVFMGNLASDLAGLHDTLNKGNASMSDRGHALANAGERTGLATRPHGEAGHGATNAAQRSSRLHVILLGESYRRAQKQNENTFGGPREVETPPLCAIRFVIELLATEFKHASPAGIASLPLLMPGLPTTLWDVHEAQYSSLLDQLESVVGGLVLAMKGPSDSVAEPVATLPSEDATTVSATGNALLTYEELVRLDAALNASLRQSAPTTCIPSLTARLLVSLREEQSCRESLSWLLDLCDVVVTRRHEAAATKLKRMAIEDGSFLPTTNSHHPPSHGQPYTTSFSAQRVTSVALGANVEILANSSLVDAVLTNASADLFYSAMNKARLALASSTKMVSDEESNLQGDDGHQQHYGNFAHPDAAKEGPSVLSLLDPSAYPSEVTRSSLVQFLQLFNSYSPQGNSWIRSASYSSEELKALHMVAARAHVAGLFLPTTSSMSPLSSGSSLAHVCGGYSLGLLPFVASPLSFSIPAIVSALFSADDAYQDLNSIQKRIESFTAQHSDYNKRVDSLSEAISALNFQVLLSQQNMPISSVAAAAARRMSVMSSTSEGPAEERSRSRSSFAQFPSIVNNPHTSAIFERIVELEREREAVLADIKAIELQSSALAEDRQKALDTLCRSQATALMACCVEAAVSALCVPLDKEVTIKMPDVVDLLTADEEANKRRREELVAKIGIGQPPKRVAGVIPPPPPSLADLTVCLPPQLHLTPLLCGQQQQHQQTQPTGRAPDASSGERKTCVSLPSRTWCAHEYLLPYNRAYMSSEVQLYREKRGSSANNGGGRSEYGSSSPTRDAHNYNNNNSNNNAMALSKHLPSASAPLKGARTKKLATALASWLSEVDVNAPEEDDELGNNQVRIIVDGLVSGAVIVAQQEYRASVAFGLNEGLGGGEKYSKDVEAQVIAAHAPRLPMVPLETTDPTTPFPTVMRGIRVNFLFAWRVAGLVMRIVACRLMPVVYKVRRLNYRLSLQPRAAFIIQCAYRRLLQTRRIRARAAVRRIERFLYSKIQVILARKARAHGVLRRAMRLWLMRKEARARVEASLALMRDEVIRRRMQCMHAKKILTQLQRLQEERTVLVHRCALQAHRILSDERSEWRKLCETIRKAFFEELAELLANQTERECLRVLVGAEDAVEDEGADWFRRQSMSHSQSQRSPSLTNHHQHHNNPPPYYMYHEGGIHRSSPSDLVGQPHDSTGFTIPAVHVTAGQENDGRPLSVTLTVDKPTTASLQISVVSKGEGQERGEEQEYEGDGDVSPLLPPEHMRRSSDAAFAFFKEYGRRLSLAQSHTIDDRQGGHGYQHGAASSSGSSRSLQLAGSDHPHTALPPSSMRRVSKKRNSQIVLNTLVDALNPQHRRSIIDLLGSSGSAAPPPQLADRRSSLAVAEQSITAWRKSRANSIFVLDASRRASYKNDHNVSGGQFPSAMSSSARLTSPPTISLQTAQNTPPPSASLLGVPPGDSSDPRRPSSDLVSLAAIKLLKGHSRLPRFSVVDPSAMSPSRATKDESTEGESNGMLVVRPQSQTTYTSTSGVTSSATRGATIGAAPHGSFSYRGHPRLQTSANASTNNAHSHHSHTMHIVAGPIILKHFKPLTLHEHTDTAEYVREIFFAPQVVNVETLRRRRRQNAPSSALDAPPAPVATTSVASPQEKAAAITNAASATYAIRGPTAACTFDDDDCSPHRNVDELDATSALFLELSGDLGQQHGSTASARRGTVLKGGGFVSISQQHDTGGLAAAAFDIGSSALSFDAVTVCRSVVFPSQQALEDVDPFCDYAKEVRALCGRPLPPRPDPPREVSQLPSGLCGGGQSSQATDTHAYRATPAHSPTGAATLIHRRQGHSQSVFRKVHKWCPAEEYDGIHRPPVLPWDCSRRPYATPTTGVGRFWLSLCSSVPLRHHRALGFKFLHFVESLHPSLFYPLCPRPFLTTDQNDFSLLQEASATLLSSHDGTTKELDSAAASSSMKLNALGQSQSNTGPLAIARRMTTAARFSIRARRESTKFGRDDDANDAGGGRKSIVGQRNSVAGLGIASVLFPLVFPMSQQDVRTDLDAAFPLNSAFGTLVSVGSLRVVGARTGKSLSPPPLLSMSDARAGLTELLMPTLSLETSATGGSHPRIESLLSRALGVGAFGLTARLAVEGYCRTALLCLKIASVYATVEDAGRVRARDDVFEAVSVLWGLNGVQRRGMQRSLLGSSSAGLGVIESTTMEALQTMGASARATLQHFVGGAMQHAALLLRSGGHDSVIVECIESASSTLIGAPSLGRHGVYPSQQRSMPSMFDVFVNSDEGGADGITNRDLELALSRLRASAGAIPLHLVLPDGFRLRNNVTTQALQGLGVGGQKGTIHVLPLLAYDYVPLTSAGLRSAPPNLWGGLMLLFGGADAVRGGTLGVATGGLSPHRSTRLMRMKSKSKRSFRRLPVTSSTAPAANINRGEEEHVWPHVAAGREASSRGATNSNRTAVVQIGGSNGSVVTGRGRDGASDVDVVLEIRGIDTSPDTSPSDTIALLNVKAGEGGESGDDDEVTTAFCELLETTERIQRKQLATEFFRIFTSIHDHIRWHMAALYLMENTRLELVPAGVNAVTNSGGGGGRTEGRTRTAEAVDGSPTNYKLRRVGDWSMRSGHGAFSGSLVIKTLTGIHPIFAEGGVIRSLRPMWVLQKGFALLQEEYAQRCAIIVEYEHTPLFTLNHTNRMGFASTDSDFKGFSRFANVRERTKSVIEPRRPSYAPPTGIANGGEPAPFRGRRTSVIVAETGERRVSLLAADGTSTARRDTIRVDVGGSPNSSTTATNRALPPRRRQSVASTGTVATELSSKGGGRGNGKDKEQTPTLPHIPSDRVYRPGVSSVRPYLSMRPKDGFGRPPNGGGPYSPSSSSARDQSDWGRDGGEGSDDEHSGGADSSTVDPFEKFGSERFGASSSSGHGRARPPPLNDMLRRRSTLEEKNDEYQRRLSLMSDVPMPANRRGTLQYTEETMSLTPGEERGRANEDGLRTRSGRRRSKHGKRATIRSGSMVNAHANDNNDEGASTPDRPRFSISGNHHPFASILHQQVSGVSPIDSPREGAMSDSGASTPRSLHSRNPSVGNTDGPAGGRGGSVNSLLFASQSRAHQQPLASGGTLSPSSFYAPASANIVIPSVRSRRMTTAEAELLFPARSPSTSAVFASLSEANSPGTPPIATSSVSATPPPPSILKSPTDKQQPALASASASGRTNPLRSNSSSEASLTTRSSATGITGNGSPRGSGGGAQERVSVNGANGSPFASTRGYQRSPTGLKVASLGTRESLHEQLRNFKFRDSLAYPQPLDLGPRHAEGLIVGGHEGAIEGLGGGSEQTGARGPSIDFSRLSVNSNFVFSARESVLTPASPSSSTRMSLEEDQLNAVARSGKDYEAHSSKAPRRLTISRPSGTL